ncbi:hypothetical protein PVK06_031867 [Gossypium arboreum]|uniref:Uncharacterized protein n=1 Tax=Gossypium arboreum TaxID=29729 RepID=A0ABR0NVJ1_GOSAR|nr:hypothetical protein PVK06_031867 [Gossypium arboreum]
MALQINNQNTVTRGTPLIQPSDQLFWFGRSRFILTLLLFTLFTMGSELKGPLVDDPVAKIMEQWLADVREKRKKQQLVKCPKNKASFPIELSFRRAAIFPSMDLPNLTCGERMYLSNTSEINEEQDDEIVQVVEAS